MLTGGCALHVHRRIRGAAPLRGIQFRDGHSPANWRLPVANERSRCRPIVREQPRALSPRVLEQSAAPQLRNNGLGRRQICCNGRAARIRDEVLVQQRLPRSAAPAINDENRPKRPSLWLA